MYFGEKGKRGDFALSGACNLYCKYTPAKHWFKTSLSLQLASLRSNGDASDPNTSPSISTIAALSYRRYWTSKGGSSERKFGLDAVVPLSWASRSFYRM